MGPVVAGRSDRGNPSIDAGPRERVNQLPETTRPCNSYAAPGGAFADRKELPITGWGRSACAKNLEMRGRSVHGYCVTVVYTLCCG